MTIPFVDGQPIYPIPEGFVEVQTDVVEAVDPEETVVPTARPETVTGRDDPSDDNRGPEFSTTDVTGIGYDRSGLTDNLRQAVDDYGFGFGALAETFGKAGVAGAVGEAFGKDPRAPTKQLTSATFKGVLETVRSSTLEQGIATASLHRVSPFTQDKIAKIADDTFNDDRIKNIFASDSDKKPPTKSQVSTSIKTLASTMQIDMFNPDGTPKTNNQIMNEIGKSIAAEKQAALEAAEKARQEETQRRIDEQNYKIDPVYQPGGGVESKAPPASKLGGFTGSKTSSGAGTGAFAGTKQGGPGSFKRGGLASRK